MYFLVWRIGKVGRNFVGETEWYICALRQKVDEIDPRGANG
jgi:hypothetical protein